MRLDHAVKLPSDQSDELDGDWDARSRTAGSLTEAKTS
jgi:hypothetical protein